MRQDQSISLYATSRGPSRSSSPDFLFPSSFLASRGSCGLFFLPAKGVLHSFSIPSRRCSYTSPRRGLGVVYSSRGRLTLHHGTSYRNTSLFRAFRVRSTNELVRRRRLLTTSVTRRSHGTLRLPTKGERKVPFLVHRRVRLFWYTISLIFIQNLCTGHTFHHRTINGRLIPRVLRSRMYLFPSRPPTRQFSNPRGDAKTILLRSTRRSNRNQFPNTINTHGNSSFSTTYLGESVVRCVPTTRASTSFLDKGQSVNDSFFRTTQFKCQRVPSARSRSTGVYFERHLRH